MPAAPAAALRLIAVAVAGVALAWALTLWVTGKGAFSHPAGATLYQQCVKAERNAGMQLATGEGRMAPAPAVCMRLPFKERVHAISAGMNEQPQPINL